MTQPIPANEDRTLDNGIIVRRYRILGTPVLCYDAWELAEGWTSHQTMTTMHGVSYGDITSRRNDDTYAQLPGGSPERIAAVRAHYEATYNASYAAILAAFPEAHNGTRSNGTIEVVYT